MTAASKERLDICTIRSEICTLLMFMKRSLYSEDFVEQDIVVRELSFEML